MCFTLYFLYLCDEDHAPMSVVPPPRCPSSVALRVFSISRVLSGATAVLPHRKKYIEVKTDRHLFFFSVFLFANRPP